MLYILLFTCVRDGILPLLDVGYVQSPTGDFEPISMITFINIDVNPAYTSSASWDVYDCPYGPDELSSPRSSLLSETRVGLTIAFAYKSLE
jgi:hypothetical protein